MRRHAVAVLLAACGRTVAPAPVSPIANHTPAEPPIQIAAPLAADLGSGLTVAVELRVAGTATSVGACTIVYSPWDDIYVVRAGVAKTTFTDRQAAIASCVDPAAADRARSRARASGKAFAIVAVPRPDSIELAHRRTDIIWCGGADGNLMLGNDPLRVLVDKP